LGFSDKRVVGLSLSSCKKSCSGYGQPQLAVLAYDKRGVGASTGRYRPFNVRESENIFEELAADARAATRWPRTQKEVDPARIGLVGGSQAGWIMPLAASIMRFTSLKAQNHNFVDLATGEPSPTHLIVSSWLKKHKFIR